MATDARKFGEADIVKRSRAWILEVMVEQRAFGMCVGSYGAIGLQCHFCFFDGLRGLVFVRSVFGRSQQPRMILRIESGVGLCGRDIDGSFRRRHIRTTSKDGPSRMEERRDERATRSILSTWI